VEVERGFTEDGTATSFVDAEDTWLTRIVDKSLWKRGVISI